MDNFINLGKEKAEELYNKFITQGMSPLEAFGKVWSIECSMDDKCGELTYKDR